MIRNPNDDPLWAAIEELRAELRNNPARATSVERGLFEFYENSMLRITDSNLQVTGEALITGLLQVIGRIVLGGLGILEVQGLIDLLGRMSVRGGGGVTVEDGGDIVVEGGEIKAGDVIIRHGKAYIGGMVLDPTEHGGAVTFPNGAQVFTDDETIQLFKGNSVVQVSDDYARLQNGGDVVEIDGDGLRISIGAVENATSTDGLHWLAIETATGRVRRVPPGVGGPGAGDFDWPFPLSTKTYGFRPPDRPTHDGVDLAGPDVTGHVIPAAGRGVVMFSGGNADDGYGYYVIVNHGTIGGVIVETLYGHMATVPTVTEGQVVSKGSPLGPVGDTGNSFGDHLHFEVRLDGAAVDPEPWMAAHGA